MTTLTLAKLDEIEAAAGRATEWIFPVADGKSIVACDPATVAALCRVAKAARALTQYEKDGAPLYIEWEDHFDVLHVALRDAGLLE